MQPTMLPKISRFQRTHTAVTGSGMPASRSRRAIDDGTARSSCSSFWRLWLTSCRIAPIVQGLTIRW